MIAAPADPRLILPSIDWRKPDYEPIFQSRLTRLKNIRESSDNLIPGLKEYYKQNCVAFVMDWGCTYDPRNIEVGLPTTIPFVLFPRQMEFLDWLFECWQSRQDGLVEKSRDMGVSWLCIAFSVWVWLFYAGASIGFGSRKEEYVDDLNNPNALFWKARTFIDYLPEEFRPAGWDKKKHAPYMKLVNPENGSTMIGEAGDNIGRGARASLYFVDESAFLEHQDSIDAALSQTTNCKIDVSTPNGAGNAFYRKRHGGKIKTFIFDWQAQPLDAKLLTPTGWRLMGDIAAGEVVIGRDGRPVEVVSIHPQGRKTVYRVSFCDGASTECCEDHLWSVIIEGDQRASRRHILHTKPLKDIAKEYVTRDGRGYRRHLFQVPLVEPITAFSDVTLPLDPYVLGCLLGDGSISSKATGPHLLTVGDAEIAERCNQRLPPGCILRHDRSIHYRFCAGDEYRGGKAGRGLHSPVSAAIRDLGLLGTESHTKFVPERYKFASPNERLDLLCGLFDTDGSVLKSHPGSTRFSTTSKKLAEDVLFLVRSLGGTAKMTPLRQAATATFPGGRVCTRRSEAFLISAKLPSGMVPFKLSRKVEAFKPAKARPPRRSIVNIEVVGEKECQCIKVANDDGLYVTDDFVVTHNSDPRKSQAWYDAQVAKLDPVVVAAEIDRNYEGSVANAFIPGDVVLAAMRRGPADVIAHGGLRVGVDVARFGDDKSVISFRRGRVLLKFVQIGSFDVVQVAARVRMEVQAFREVPEQIAVDVINMGAGVADILRGYYPDKLDARTGKRLKTVVDVNSSLRMDNGQQYNLRAFMWAEMREWLKTASIPNDEELKSQLTSIRYGFKGGELLLEDKTEAKIKRGVKSPDIADSIAFTFAEAPVPMDLPRPKVPTYRAVDSGLGALG